MTEARRGELQRPGAVTGRQPCPVASIPPCTDQIRPKPRRASGDPSDWPIVNRLRQIAFWGAGLRGWPLPRTRRRRSICATVRARELADEAQLRTQYQRQPGAAPASRVGRSIRISPAGTTCGATAGCAAGCCKHQPPHRRRCCATSDRIRLACSPGAHQPRCGNKRRGPVGR
jgi:hypothetical protein